jgi:hypothetical protein
MDLRELATRLTKLEDERAIRDTLYAYGHTLDYGDEEGWADCFTAAARRESRRRIDPSKTTLCVGSDQIRDFAKNHTRPPGKYHKHIVADVRIECDGVSDQARAVSYFLKVDEDPSRGHPFIQAMGRYIDTLRRCKDGKWRIEDRLCEVENL